MRYLPRNVSQSEHFNYVTLVTKFQRNHHEWFFITKCCSECYLKLLFSFFELGNWMLAIITLYQNRKQENQQSHRIVIEIINWVVCIWECSNVIWLGLFVYLIFHIWMNLSRKSNPPSHKIHLTHTAIWISIAGITWFVHLVIDTICFMCVRQRGRIDF